ncbi:MAG TPA: hypothetical protein VKE74_28970, partial [Gemmataceae bacterium]|nr:hypothetical protein [Gemmataceae bacterium]
MRARAPLSALAFLALAILVGCSKTPPPGSPGDTSNGGSPGSIPDNPNADVRPWLYTPAKAPDYKAPPAPGTDPIVIANCTVQMEDRQQASSELDNVKIDPIGTP